MTEINWQQQPPERAGIYTCEDYEVRWYFEGGTGFKQWQAKNPAGQIRKGFLSKDSAMALCEKGINQAREKARKRAVKDSGELAEMKAKGKAQIADMREMLQ